MKSIQPTETVTVELGGKKFVLNIIHDQYQTVYFSSDVHEGRPKNGTLGVIVNNEGSSPFDGILPGFTVGRQKAVATLLRLKFGV